MANPSTMHRQVMGVNSPANNHKMHTIFLGRVEFQTSISRKTLCSAGSTTFRLEAESGSGAVLDGYRASFSVDGSPPEFFRCAVAFLSRCQYLETTPTSEPPAPTKDLPQSARSCQPDFIRILMNGLIHQT